MIYFYLLCFAVLLGVVFSKSKIILACIIALIYIIVMYSGQGNDLSNLNDSFDLNRVANDAGDRSIVFYSLLYAFNEAGYSFFQFRVFHFVFFIIALLLLTMRLTKESTYVVACCALFPILSFGSQMRNGLGVAFLFLGFFFLLVIKKKYIRYPLFVLFTLFATTIHYIFIVYLLALLPFVNWKREALLKRSFMAMFVLFIMVFAGKFAGIIGFMGDWYSRYAEGVDFSIRLQIPLMILIGINTAFICKCEDYVARNSSFSLNEKSIVIYVSRLNIVFLSLIPLLFMSGSFFRIYQNITFFSAIAIAITGSRYFVKGMNQGGYLKGVYFVFYLFYTVFYIHWQGEFFVAMRSITL